MTVYNQDFEMFQGEDKVIKAPIIDSDGDPLVMTAATAIVYKLFFGKGATTASVEKTLDDGVSLYNASSTDDGLQVILVPNDTNTLKPGNYYQEARVTLGGKSEVVYEGKITLHRSKTL